MFTRREGRGNNFNNSVIMRAYCAGSRYGDFKCIHDRTHRVCAKLVDNSDNSCREVMWPMGTSRSVSFWDITGQQRWNWKQRICAAPNPGDSWCICMWASANIVAEVTQRIIHSSRERKVKLFLLSWWEVRSEKCYRHFRLHKVWFTSF